MDQESKIEKWKVIVIGAGIAGLTIAKELKAKGMMPLVLQASSRVGGRTITEKVGDREIDLGATMIHGIGPGDELNACPGRCNPIYEIAKEYNLKTTLIYSAEEECQDFYYEQDGRDLAEEFDFDEAYERAQEFFDEEAEYAKPEESVSDYMDKFLLKYPKDEQRYAFLAAKTLFHTYGASLQDLSMTLQDKDSIFNGHEAVFPQRGYSDVVNILRKGLVIQTDRPVSKIEYSDQGVSVYCQNGKSYEAEYVAITVSLGVLKSKIIEFSPELPAQKQQAISKIGFTNYHKIYMEFETRFWNDQADFILCANGFEFMNIGRYLKIPALILFCRHEMANEWEQFDDTQAKRRVLEVLEKLFVKPSKLTLFIRTKWGQNKYVQGGFSYPKKGQVLNDVDELKKSVMGRLFFGGEATCFEFFGCTSAAALSGERVSSEISSLVEQQKPK